MHIWKRFDVYVWCGWVVPILCLVFSRSATADENQTILQKIWGDRTEVDAGVGVAWLSKYVGSEDGKFVMVPTLSVYRGAFFLDSIRGIGVEYLHDNGIYASVGLGYDPGREERDSTWRPGSRRLRGMGRVGGATTLNVLAAVPLGKWLSVNGEADLRVGGASRGDRYRAALEVSALDDEENLLTLGAHVHWGDRRYNQTFFGVTPAQGAGTGFHVFLPEAGAYGHGLVVDWHRYLDRNWTLSMGVKALRLSGRLKSSPIIEKREDLSGFASLHYRF